MAELQQVEKPKPSKPRAEPITYKITPSNYDTLAEDEKVQKLREFVAVLRTIDKELMVSMVHKPVTIQYSGAERTYLSKDVYFTSKQDLGQSIASAQIKSMRCDTPFGHEIEREEMSHIKMADGTYSRAYTLYDMPKSITAAWIGSLFGIANEVHIWFRPVKPSTARRMLLTHANTLEARIGRRHLEEAVQARQINDMIQSQETVAYTVNVTAVISAASAKELRKACKEFEKTAGWRSIRCMAVSGKQLDTLMGWGHQFMFDLGSCTVFHPFASSDLIEADGAGGVYVGVNEITKAPVIYDYTRRVNYNMSVIGESGSGKSTMVKTYVDNFLKMVKEKYGPDQRVMLTIIDPHGEYAGIAEHFGCSVVDLTARNELGMDPFVIMEHPDQAVGILCETVGMPANLRSLAIARSEGCHSIVEFMKRLKNEKGAQKDECTKAHSYLEQFVTGGISNMFRGKYEKRDRNVFSMYKAEKNELNSMLISMAMQRAWRDMRDAPSHVPKLFVIDEGWFVIAMRSTAEILQDVAKSGRKENVHLMFLTQEPEDIMKSEYGTAVINNSATVLVLKLKPKPAEMLQGVLRLSNSETKAIQQLDIGHGVMRADAHRINLHVTPDDEQLKIFNTSVSIGR